MSNYQKKKFFPGVQHLYQRSDDWGVIFYDDIDRLAYYTEACVAKRSREVVVLAASIMFNHVHQTVKVKTKEQLSDYAWSSTSPFSRAYNARYCRKGDLFHRKFGWASKRNEKAVRNNICYVENNHVEKRLCTKASRSRWDFLAYAVSTHPFSPEIISPSRRLLHSMRIVKKRSSADKPLKYSHLRLMFDSLDQVETEQLKDYIVSTYRLVDFEETVTYFKGVDEMISAPDMLTGSEYEIAEEYSTYSETPYCQMLAISHQNRWNVFTMSEEVKKYHAIELLSRTSAKIEQVSRFLHIECLR